MGKYADIQKLEIGGYVEIFELDMGIFDQPSIYFHGYEKVGSIWWQGTEYLPHPISVAGLGRTGEAQQPFPTLSVGNMGEINGQVISGIISAMCLQFQDLVGARIIMRSVLVKYLDAENFPILPYTLRLDGTNGVQLPALPELALGNGGVTFEAWVNLRVSKATTIRQTIIGGQDGSYGLAFSGRNLQFMVNGKTNQSTPSTNVPLNTWTHVAVTREVAGNMMRYYVNGTQVVSGGANISAGLVAGALTNMIGQGLAANTGLSGSVRNVRIYNKTLSASQIAQAAAQGTTYDPIVAYSGDQIDGLVLEDSTRRKNATVLPGGKFEPIGFGNPSANPNEGFPDEIWIIDQRMTELPEQIDFQLANPMNMEGRKFPDRPITANICCWKWKGGYKGPYCGYIPGPMFNKDNVPVNDPALDKCPGTLQACRIRFEAKGQPLNFGGHPSADNLRGF